MSSRIVVEKIYFPEIIFLNTSLPKDQIRILKSEEEISQLADNCTDIFKSNIIIRNYNRPQTGTFLSLKNVFLVELVVWYTAPTPDENDFQPSKLNKIDFFGNNLALPERIILQDNQTSKVNFHQ